MLLCSVLNAQKYPDKNVDSLWIKINFSITEQNYSSARADIKILKNNYPKLPLGYMLNAAIEITEAYDLGIPYNESKIDSFLNRSYLLSEVLLEDDEESIWANYFAGASLGFKAYFKAIKGELVSALVDGFSALQYFDECLSINPNFYEAKIAIGSYLYWKSEKTSQLSWLPFFNDDKKTGINLLYQAADSAKYNALFAKYSLIWILIQETKFSEAQKIAEDFLLDHPSSRQFQYAAGKAYEKTNIEITLNYYLKLYNSYIRNSTNQLKEIIFAHKIAQLYFLMQKYKETVEYCDKIPKRETLSEFVIKSLGDRLERAAILRDNALRLASKN